MKPLLILISAFALTTIACNKGDDSPAVTDFAPGFVGAYGKVTKDGQSVTGTIIVTQSDINQVKFTVGADVYFGKTTSSTAFEVIAGTLGSAGLELRSGGGVLTGNALDYTIKFKTSGGTNDSNTYHAVKQ